MLIKNLSIPHMGDTWSMELLTKLAVALIHVLGIW